MTRTKHKEALRQNAQRSDVFPTPHSYREPRWGSILSSLNQRTIPQRIERNGHHMCSTNPASIIGRRWVHRRGPQQYRITTTAAERQQGIQASQKPGIILFPLLIYIEPCTLNRAMLSLSSMLPLSITVPRKCQVYWFPRAHRYRQVLQ